MHIFIYDQNPPSSIRKHFTVTRCTQDVLESYISLITRLSRSYDHPQHTAVSQRRKSLFISYNASAVITTRNCSSEQLSTLTV